MGIRGLTSYVAARQDECATEVEDLTNVTLGVDLDSFLHFACRELVHTIDAHWLLLGGDARALYVWVRAWMRPLFERKIRLKFVRDPPGMLNTIKDVARGRRRSEKMEKSKSVVQGLYAPPTPLSPQGIDEVSPLAPTVPLDLVQLTEEAATTLMETQAVFAFARKALVTCLQHAGCSIVTAPIEADETLGELVRSKTIFAAVAHDSDYLIMHKVRYIPFSSIQVDPTSGFVRATVFDSDKLAAVSGLAPEKLVEWAIVCGNDFTPYVDMHFNLAKALHLPALRQSQGSYDVADALVWLQEHLGTSNWLDDPEFKELLTHDNDLLTHVYGIYCFYGVGGAVKKRFPTAVRHAVLSTVEWKRARKLLDKAMLPSFAIDVMFDQRRSLSHRWMFGDLTWCPLLAAARQGTYGLLRQTNVEEYVTCVLTGNLITRLVTATPSDVGLDTKHAKSIRADHFQAMVLSWVAVASTVHTALATWKPPKKQVELKFVGYALGMVLAASDTLSYNTWTTLLLTSVVSICIQKESSPSIAFVPPAGLSREVVETACRYLSSLEALFHVCDILKLHTDVNCHAFYSASLFAYFLKTSLVSKTTVQRMVADPALALTEEQVQACMWSFHTLVDLFAKALPPTTASSSLSPSMELQTDINGSVEGTRDLLTPAVILLKNPTMAKKGAKKFVKKASRSTVAFPTEKLRKPTAINATDSDGNLHPFEWAVDVSQTPTENVAPAPKDLKQLIFSLPVFKHKEEILDHVATNPLVVIQGETGCGKSTSVPQFLLDANAETANIYVTQPRRVAALTLAATVARMRGETVGATIGYRVGQMQHDSDKTQITYVTTGYMLERLIHNPDSVKGVTHLILDEAHERSMDMDMLLLMVATNWRLFPALKLVIMSATMDASIFFKYFKPVLPVPMQHSDELFVGSALHPVKTVFLEDMKRIPGLKVGKLAEALNSWDKSMMNDVEMMTKQLQKVVTAQLDLCVQVAHTIVKSQGGSGCILIFVSGLADIQYLHEKFESWPMIQLFVLHSDIEMDDQAKAFKDVQGKMKIILSTNIAESSVTIPDVTHIVNTALEKQILMDKTTKSEVLVRMWCSKASVKQRSGRAGRIRPGVAFHLFTKRFMETCMDEYTTPELLRKPLDKVVLQMKAQMQHIGTPSELLAQAVTPPDVANIDMAYKMLHTFSAVTSPREEDSITSFGLFSVHFPLDIRLCRLLMYGLTAWEWGVGVVDVVLLVAVLASPDLHLAPSRFHIASSDMYMHEMKAVLAAKLELQEGDVRSEPLAIWKLMVQCLACTNKGQVVGLLKKFAISFRRFQTTLVLVGELCVRLIRLAKKPPYRGLRALQPSMVAHLERLQKFSGRMYSSEPWTYAHAPLPMLRFLLVLNYHDCLARGRLPEKKGKGAKGGKAKKEKIQGPLSAQLAIKVDTTCQWGLKIPPEHFKYLVEPLTLEPEVHHVSKNPKGFDLKVSPGSTPFPFSVSLLFFLREGRFPVDLPVLPLWLPAPGDPDALRIRFNDLNVGGLIRWQQTPSEKNLSVSGRSVFALPQLKLDKKMIVGVFAEQLLTGDGSTLMGGCCTLLPPHVDSYYPVVMLITTKCDVWLYMDGSRKFWTQAKIDGVNYVIEESRCVPLQPTLKIINTVRTELSRGLVDALLTTDNKKDDATITSSDMDALFETRHKKLNGMTWVRVTLDVTNDVPFPPFDVE